MGTYKIVSHSGSGLPLNLATSGTISGRTNVNIWSDTGSNDQRWSINSLGANQQVKTLNNLYYMLNANTSTWNCDVYTANSDAYVNFVTVSTGIYRLQLKSNTARYLTADGSTSGSNVSWQALNSASNAQKWNVTTSGAVDNPYKDYSGTNILTSAQVTLLNGNKSFYQAAAQSYGIPWQMLAAIHFREYKLQKAGPSNGNGPYQITTRTYPTGAYSDAQFQTATNDAASFVLGKAGGRNLTVLNNAKYTFFAYNGVAGAYKTQAKNLGFTDAQADIGEGSPYVMNRADAKRDPTIEPTKSNRTWGQIVNDGGGISYPANNDHGAFVLYQLLL